MNLGTRQSFAFCTLCIIVLCGGVAQGASVADSENFAEYTWVRTQWGATTLPIGAQLLYRDAIAELHVGNVDAAVTLLKQASALDPNYPDPYLTLSKIKFRQFDSDALHYFVRGVSLSARGFPYQSLLVVNTMIVLVLLLILVTTIVGMAFAFRYLPFMAHRLGETLSRRYRAATPLLTAYLIIGMLFVVYPSFVTALAVLILTTWYFMRPLEKFVLAFLVLCLVFLGVFTSHLKLFTPLTDPNSFTSLSAKSVSAPGLPSLISRIEHTPAAGLDADKHLAIGLLYQRQENARAAADHFLKAVEQRPEDAKGYVNLGNVYYEEGLYDKALEGYRKAEQVDSTDAVLQFNLAQAYIKTLLMGQSSVALRSAASAGIEDVKATFAPDALTYLQVYPKTFSARDMWRIARVESGHYDVSVIDQVMTPFTRFSPQISAWILLGALLLALIISKVLRRKHLAFQCSNCGRLTCDSCCNHDRGMYICQACAQVIHGVTSSKVVDALLRQRRQAIVIKRRKSLRLLALAPPGVHHIYYGRLGRGILLGAVFCLCLIQLWSRGFVIPHWNALMVEMPIWKWVVPAVGLAWMLAISVFSKGYYEVRHSRSPLRLADTEDDDDSLSLSA